jgi:putative DNA primase/helicase
MNCDTCRFDGTTTCAERIAVLGTECCPPIETAAELQQIAAAVEQRSTEMLAALDPEKDLIDPRFVKQCLDANERGDGVLFAALNRGKFLCNVSVKDAKKETPWYRWGGHVWQRDDFSEVYNAAEAAALAYQQQADVLQDDIRENKITEKKHWKICLRDKYKARAGRLRSQNGATKAMHWAPIVDQSMAAREGDFNQQPWLLPCKNGVINLQTGNLDQGRPCDLLTKAIDIEYDPHADYSDWLDFLEEVCDNKEIAAFAKRSFGYAATGFSHEQYIWCFVGTGRNGKGVLFDLIGDILGPFYHEISRAMLVEQRTEPGPNAASEHKYSLIGKRLILGSETNKGQKIDAAAIKGLTGEDRINCRPNFKSEIIFKATHSLFLQTNHLPAGLTKDFALKQRTLKIEFPWMYVDDPETEATTAPNQAHRFKPKDKDLKERLRKIKPGILRWIVEGCLEWQQIGISPPDCILKAVDDMAREEDKFGQFVSECLNRDDAECETPFRDLYAAFAWWWDENQDGRESRLWSKIAVAKNFEERGYQQIARNGIKYRKGVQVNYSIRIEVSDHHQKRR